MSFSRSRSGAAVAIVSAIIRGDAWAASSVRNPVLRSHYRRLGRCFCRANDITDSLRESSLRLFAAIIGRGDLLTSPHSLKRELIPGLLRMAAYADRWIREPEDWVNEGGDLFDALLKHLFVRWEVPCFFRLAWLTKGRLRHLDRDWYCEVAGGKSWRKCDGVPRSVSRRAIHRAMKAPENLTMVQALRWGQLTELGFSSESIGEALSESLTTNLSSDDIWFSLIQKFQGEGDSGFLDFGMIGDFFEVLYRSYQFQRARDLVQLSKSDLLNHCCRYWNTLLDAAQEDGVKFRNPDVRNVGLRKELKQFTFSQWDPMDRVLDEEIRMGRKGGQRTVWRVFQLHRHSQLLAEGMAMRHCVAGYREKCQRGASAIFSIRRLHENESAANLESVMTVEVCRASRRIVQARGRWNARLTCSDEDVLRAWAERNNMEL
jgi:hypothetical protein